MLPTSNPDNEIGALDKRNVQCPIVLLFTNRTSSGPCVGCRPTLLTFFWVFLLSVQSV
jgi:hypothetical protein